MKEQIIKEIVMEKDKILGIVKETFDYSKFKFHPYNRDIQQSNINQKVNSIKKFGQLMPIYIDGQFRIVDGQNRFKACEILEFPVKYCMIKEEYGMAELQAMQISSNWNINDYIVSEIKKGNKEYIKLQAYVDQYGFAPDLIASVLNDTTCSQSIVIKTGSFKITNEEKGIDMLNKLKEIETCIKNMNEKVYRTFKLFFDHPHYNHQRMLDQLDKHFNKFKEDKNRDFSWNMERTRRGMFFETIYNYYLPNKIMIYDRFKDEKQK